ncbi:MULTISPECIES: hypothetical protein [Petrotoga]|uniref:hypothetical protein n=1 Tax=Petrotoga TaxID=28236 RepID=UPI001304BAEB|nr:MULTISPECIES: hypothetical protein [Petrotoga]
MLFLFMFLKRKKEKNSTKNSSLNIETLFGLDIIFLLTGIQSTHYLISMVINYHLI